jgi:hypothetical protein
MGVVMVVIMAMRVTDSERIVTLGMLVLGSHVGLRYPHRVSDDPVSRTSPTRLDKGALAPGLVCRRPRRTTAR